MREIIYNITQRSTGRRVALANLTEEFTKDNLLGIINKTQGEVLYTPLQVGNIQNFQYQEGSMLITLSASVPSINAGDELFVKLYSENDIDLTHIAKEQTLNDGVSTLSSKIDNIDLSSIENKVDTESQAIQSAIQNIDLSSVESKVDEVKQAVENIDLSPVESKVEEGVNTLSSKIDNIDLSAVENKVQEESAAIQAKIDNIKLPEIDTSAIAKESTLNAVSSQVAKQGENQEATNSAILSAIKGISSVYFVKNQDRENTYTMVIKNITSMKIVDSTIIV